MPVAPPMKNDDDRRLSRAETAVNARRLTAPEAARFYDVDLDELTRRLYFEHEDQRD